MINEETIEREVERRMDALDRQLLDGRLGQKEYDHQVRLLGDWAKGQYAAKLLGGSNVRIFGNPPVMYARSAIKYQNAGDRKDEDTEVMLDRAKTCWGAAIRMGIIVE